METMAIANKKIIFCFPYRGAGGVPLLFVRLGNYLKTIGYDITIVDYIDGFMSTNNTNNLNFIEYQDDVEINIPDDSILVLQSMTPWSIYPSLKIGQKTNLFFITTIPANFYPALPIFRDMILQGGLFAKAVWHTIFIDEYRKMKRFVDLGIKKDSIVFLDDDIVCNVSHSLNVELSAPNILPLFSENVVENAYKKTPHNEPGEFVVGWVGRIADFKVHILNKTIEDLKKYSQNHNLKIRYIIIGQGEKEKELLSENTENFTISRINHINPSALKEKLLQFDLYFAMGTSALDGARLGVPTVRLDYSFRKIDKGYRYKFFFDIKGYSLGENINSKCYNEGVYGIEELIIRALKEKNILSDLTYDFYNKHHSLNNSALKFIGFIDNSRLTYGDLTEANVMSSRWYNFWKIIRS